MQRNYVQLAGYVGADPEVRPASNGDLRATFPLATSERWGHGPDAQRTEWHRVVAWGPTATFCQQNLKKGSRIFIEGQIRSRVFERNGERRTRVEIRVLPGAIQFLRPPPKSAEETPAEDGVSAAQSTTTAAAGELVVEVSR